MFPTLMGEKGFCAVRLKLNRVVADAVQIAIGTTEVEKRKIMFATK